MRNKLKRSSEVKQVEVTPEIHKALKLEAADRDLSMKRLLNDILEGWLESNRPEWVRPKKDPESL